MSLFQERALVLSFGILCLAEGHCGEELGSDVLVLDLPDVHELEHVRRARFLPGAQVSEDRGADEPTQNQG